MMRRILRLTALLCAVVLLLSLPAYAFDFFFFGSEETETGAVKLKKLVLSPRTRELLAGDTVQLSVIAQPAGAVFGELEWTSNREHIATVDEEGVVTAHAYGSAKITATDPDSGKKVNCTIKVYVRPTEMTLNRGELELRTGRKSTLRVSFNPSRGMRKEDKVVTWSTSNPEVATVDAKGRVVAVAPGTCTVTASTDYEVQSSCAVTVT
jgi:uncharacterized protein YjdB